MKLIFSAVMGIDFIGLALSWWVSMPLECKKSYLIPTSGFTLEENILYVYCKMSHVSLTLRVDSEW